MGRSDYAGENSQTAGKQLFGSAVDRARFAIDHACMAIVGSNRSKMRSPTFLALCSAFILTSCQAAIDSPAQNRPEPTDVSMIQLIATPDKFEGKKVRVIGYLHLEFEGNGLYTHQDDFLHALHRNGVWINVDKCGYPGKASINDNYVLVEGRFTGKDNGHMGLWSGSLSDVSRCMIWPGRFTERAS